MTSHVKGYRWRRKRTREREKKVARTRELERLLFFLYHHFSHHIQRVLEKERSRSYSTKVSKWQLPLVTTLRVQSPECVCSHSLKIIRRPDSPMLL